MGAKQQGIRAAVVAIAAALIGCGPGALLEQTVYEAQVARSYDARAYEVSEAFRHAQSLQNGPERDRAWREAANEYRSLLEKDPGGDRAPEATIHGAYAYKQVGDYGGAIALYELFVRANADEARLARLEKGDPQKYTRRLKDLQESYDLLAQARLLSFDYRGCAESYAAIADSPRMKPEDRRQAAQNALILYTNIGDPEALRAAKASWLSLHPADEKKADLEHALAVATLRGWDERQPDTGQNRAARQKAQREMDAFATRYASKPKQARYVVEAAYRSAKLRIAGREPGYEGWCKRSVDAFERWAAASPGGRGAALGSPEADMAAECAYRLLDAKIAAEFDYETGHHRYSGDAAGALKTFDADLTKIPAYAAALQEIISRYDSKPWSAAARARQASLHASCYTGLFEAREPLLRLFTAAEEKLLRRMEAAEGRDELQLKSRELRSRRQELWRLTRERRAEGTEREMLRLSMEAALWARSWNVSNPEVDRARRRLALFTSTLGDAKLREAARGLVDSVTHQPFVYTDGLFLRLYPGRLAEPPREVSPPPRLRP